jgi:hypothetical protein
MHAFIVDELMFAMAQGVREQALLARPHMARPGPLPASLQPRAVGSSVRVIRNPAARAGRARPRARGGCR